MPKDRLSENLSGKGNLAVVHAFRCWGGDPNSPQLVKAKEDLHFLMEGFRFRPYGEAVEPMGVGQKGIVYRVSLYSAYEDPKNPLVYPVPPRWKDILARAEDLGWHAVFTPWESWVEGQVFLTPVQAVLSLAQRLRHGGAGR